MTPGFVLGALLFPPAGPLLVALGALFAMRYSPRVGRLITAGAVVSLLALTLPVTSALLIERLRQYPMLDQTRARDARAIVVVSAGAFGSASGLNNDRLTPRTLIRVLAAARLVRSTGLPLLVSGGKSGSSVADSVIMQQVLRDDFGIEPRWIESRSTSTAENASESARILGAAGIDKIALVTDAIHMSRAVRLFTAAGFEVLPAPSEIRNTGNPALASWIPSSVAFQTSCEAIHEIAGLAFSRFSHA